VEQSINNQDKGIIEFLSSDHCPGELYPPKAFWKYYDLYRRGKISADEYMNLSGFSATMLSRYLSSI